MTMHDLLIAAQLMSEERVGKPLREYERQQRAKDRDARLRLLEVSGGRTSR